MTDQEINNAIIESLGWTLGGEKCFFVKDGQIVEFGLPNCDLNAMHEAEEFLYKKHDRSFTRYAESLSFVMFGKSWESDIKELANLSILLNSEASPRAEAYLRTIGKWRE